MYTYLVSYDLRRPGQDYAALFDLLKAMPGWCKPLESVWIVKTQVTAEELAQTLLRVMDANDRLVVVNFKGAAWSNNLDSQVAAWMRSQL